MKLASLFTVVFALAAIPSAQRGIAPDRSVTTLDDPAGFRRPGLAPFAPGSARSVDSLPPAFVREANPAIVVTGYWPPSNEAVRRFSADPVQNPDGWIGQDWEGRGYDVFAYFPEFMPRNCTNCGKGEGDFEVDYQDTTGDFRPIVDAHDPVAIITASRGNSSLSWELEMNQFNRASWIPDYLAPTLPDPSPPDASVPAEALRLSSLPVQDIADAVNAAALGVVASICFTGNGGGFLSEFIAYQGVWYRSDHRSPTFQDWCVAAGHIHIGTPVSWDAAKAAFRISLREVIAHVDATVANTVCQPDSAAGGPGSAQLRFCGEPMATGNSGDLLLQGAPGGTLAILVASTNFGSPFPWKGGLVQPFPVFISKVLPVDGTGTAFLEGLPGGHGPVTFHSQVLYKDASQANGWGFSNTVAIALLP